MSDKIIKDDSTSSKEDESMEGDPDPVDVRAENRHLSDQRRKGRWTLDETVRFLRCLEKYGVGPWKRMITFFPNRSLSQVRSHAQKVLKSLSLGNDLFGRYNVSISQERLNELLSQASINYRRKPTTSAPPVRRDDAPTLARSQKLQEGVFVVVGGDDGSFINCEESLFEPTVALWRDKFDKFSSPSGENGQQKAAIVRTILRELESYGCLFCEWVALNNKGVIGSGKKHAPSLELVRVTDVARIFDKITQCLMLPHAASAIDNTVGRKRRREAGNVDPSTDAKQQGSFKHRRREDEEKKVEDEEEEGHAGSPPAPPLGGCLPRQRWSTLARSLQMGAVDGGAFSYAAMLLNNPEAAHAYTMRKAAASCDPTGSF